jgi:hypothetical protein
MAITNTYPQHPVLDALAAMSDHLRTCELARIFGVQPQTIRKSHSQNGAYLGIVPRKLPGKRGLLWPIDAVATLFQGPK